jgi:hypothetical protein
MTFYILLIHVVCCLFQSIFLCFPSNVAGNNTQVFYCVREEWRIPRYISWYCLDWKLTIFILMFTLILCVPTNTAYWVIFIFCFVIRLLFTIHLIVCYNLWQFGSDSFVASRRLATSYREILDISLPSEGRVYEFPTVRSNDTVIT